MMMVIHWGQIIFLRVSFNIYHSQSPVKVYTPASHNQSCQLPRILIGLDQPPRRLWTGQGDPYKYVGREEKFPLLCKRYPYSSLPLSLTENVPTVWNWNLKPPMPTQHLQKSCPIELATLQRIFPHKEWTVHYNRGITEYIFINLMYTTTYHTSFIIIKSTEAIKWIW